jgi:NitT/TauT family transport system ATP-binding protein
VSPVREGGHAAPSLLAVSDVTIRYATHDRVVTAVEDVSFDVATGEKFVLLGPSGCGKSTLLKAIAGFIPPVAGSIALHGRPVDRPGPDRVVVFQEFDQLLPWKTVLGNVVYPLKVTRRVAAHQLRAHALGFVEMVGLERFKDAFPHTLSGGMKQRVAIARSLALGPEMLLMDEPFASLDALTRTRMQDELNGIWRETRKTILFVTHSIQEAVILGSRILVMTPGPGRVRTILANEAAGAPLDSPPFMAMQQRIRDLLELDSHGRGED